jgi:hypothetical protein
MFLVSRRGLAESSPALQCGISIILKRPVPPGTIENGNVGVRNFTWSGNITAIDRPWRDAPLFSAPTPH